MLDPLLPIFEKEGWTLPMIASDWGISLATLEAHLTQEVPIVKKVEIDWQRFDELKAQGLSMVRISKEMDIPRTTLGPRAQEREKEHQSTPKEHQDTPEAHPSTPDEPGLLTVHSGTPEPTEISLDEQYTQEHLSTLQDVDHTEVHPGTLEAHQEVMEDISQTVPDVPSYEYRGGTPEYTGTPQHTRSTPGAESRTLKYGTLWCTCSSGPPYQHTHGTPRHTL
jgi:hypothetical protein